MTARVWVVGLLVACADNQAPVVADVEASTDEDTPVDVRVLDGVRDPDGDSLRLMSASPPPGHSAEIVDGATIRVTPMANFHGRLEIGFLVSDGTSFAGARAAVTVRPVNDPPVALARTISLHRSATVELAGSDIDGDPLTFEIVTGPAHGTLDGTAPALRYTTELGYTGSDAIMYRVHDGQVASQVATVQLDVRLNAPPVVVGAGHPANEDQAATLRVEASDPDGDRLTFELVTPPSQGTLTGDLPNVVYTPAANFHGDDRFEVRVSDGELTASAIIGIAVVPLNDAPVAVAQTVDATEDTGRTITLEATDVDEDPLAFQIVAAPLHGSLSGSGATRTYTPAPNYHGPDSFTFLAVDGTVASAPATVTIDVASVPDAPVGTPASRTLTEDGSTAIQLAGTDGDGDALTFAIASQPAHGTLTGTPPDLSYVPAANFHGGDTFQFTVSDGATTSAPATVTLTVTPVNDAPVASDSTAATTEDAAVAISLVASDIDGTPLTFSIVTPPADGSLTGSGATRTYTPAANATGTRTFTFRVFDESLSATATVTIEITPVNDPPTLGDDFVATDPDTALDIDVLRNDTDVESSALAIDGAAAPAHGDIEIVDGHLVYTPDAGFTGIDTFEYTARDADGATATARIHVGVGTFPPGAPAELLAQVGASSLDRAPALSSDGRHVVFATALALAPGDNNNRFDVYAFDRGTRTLRRISNALDGGDGNGDSQRASISGSGRYVVYQSTASNLVPGDTNGRLDVFRTDRVTGATVRVSVSSAGGQGSNQSSFATISDDGNLVAFASDAFELVADDANGASDVFIRNIEAGTTARASVTMAGTEADLASTEPAISGDGRSVVFTSLATNLVAADSNGVGDIFLRDLTAGTTGRLSVSSTGTQANARSFGPSVSRDGRFVSFLSSATNLVPGSTSPGLPYVRGVQVATTTVGVTTVMDVVRLSGDGRYLAAYRLSSTVLLRDRFAAVTHFPPGAAAMSFPSLSSNGRYMAVLQDGNVVVVPNPL